MTTGQAAGDQSGDVELDQLARRARKRWLLTLAGSVAAGVATAALLPLLIGGRHDRPRHHGSVSGRIVAGAIALCVLVAVLALLAVFLRKSWRDQGLFAVPLMMGLERKDRRAVSRAVRRGCPSDDPKLAAVELALAQRVVTQARLSTVTFAIAIVGEGALAVTHEGAAARVFFGGAAVLFAAALIAQRVTLRGARRYLAQAPAAPAPPSHAD